MREILGRDDDLARITAFLSRETQEHLLVLEGEPEIGKTTLWRSCVEQARGEGYRVLACAATSAKSQLSFSGLRDLHQRFMTSEGLPSIAAFC